MRIALALFGALALAAVRPAAQTPSSSRLSDRQFWDLVVNSSEPDRAFRSTGAIRTDNLISNEKGFQAVVPDLATIKRGAYVGVGPDQNFTYIAAIKPTVAFIVDIRRDNMLLHLMYKALIEMSDDRADFLARLFSRPRPAGLAAGLSARDLLAAFGRVRTNDAAARANLEAIFARLEHTHGFTLTAGDENSIRSAYRAFVSAGPDIRWDTSGAQWIPTYAELMTETDRQGVERSYLASEELFHALKSCEGENRLVPIVGDFAGPRALRAVAGYLRAHGDRLAAFYISNVETYLAGRVSAFSDNVAAMPIDDASIFIRTTITPIGSGRGGIEYSTATHLDPIVVAGRR